MQAIAIWICTFLLLLGAMFYPSPAVAEELTVTVNLTSADGIGAAIGTMRAKDTDYGLVITPDLSGLPPGIHGFHIHEKPDCSAAVKDGAIVPGLAAGGHYDPAHKASHQGPYADGHLGDLPPLFASADGIVSLPVLAPRISLSDLSDRALMVHTGGDNYSDIPPLGGGGDRLACGVVE